MALVTNVLLTTVLFSNCISSSIASEFLKNTPKDLEEHMSISEIRAALFGEIEAAGAGIALKRCDDMEKALSPIYAALPKNEYGNLVHSTVRFALHRLFVMRHGWVIKGLSTDRVAKNSSSPSTILKNQVPLYIENLFEDRLKGKGFRLHELATLAATIEHLIQSEADEKLKDVFNIYSYPMSRILSEEEVEQVLDTYIMGHILGRSLVNMTIDDATSFLQDIPDLFLGWNDTRDFVRSVRRSTLANHEPFDFANLAKVVENVGEQHGTFQDAECQGMKKTLMKSEHLGTGRIRLADFYRPAAQGADGAWQFQESVAYLRQLGALDDSNPADLSVIIPNYILSQTNCLAASGFYSVCCKDECESLMGHLEKSIAAPQAMPDTILDLIKELPSSTVEDPRQLSGTLVRRLNDIALHHGGDVPVHGRLFAQWMHHAYPRECPYPQLSGTTGSQTAEEWLDETGSDSIANEEEMNQYLSDTPTVNVPTHRILANEEIMPWTSEEELFIVHSSANSVRKTSPVIRSLALLAASASLAFSLVQTFKKGLVGSSMNAQKVMV
jgi:hypothetical protein